MSNQKEVAENFRKVLEKEFNPCLIPIKDKNQIQIGKYSILKKKNGYTIKNLKDKSILARTYSKTAAIALAKNIDRKNNIKQQVLYLDNLIHKNYVDCLFYKNSLKSKQLNCDLKDCLKIRLDFSFQKIEEAKDLLRHYVLN